MEYTDVSRAVNGLMDAFEEFKSQQDARMTALEKEAEETALRLDRPGATSAFSVKGNLAAERKALGAFAKSGDERELKTVAGLSTDNDPGGGYVVLPHMAETRSAASTIRARSAAWRGRS